MKLGLNRERSAALREFSEAMPLAIQNIVESTQQIIQVYNSVAEELGEHEQDFYNMLMLIKKAQEEAADAIQELPKQLNLTVDKIDAYIDAHPTADAK